MEWGEAWRWWSAAAVIGARRRLPPTFWRSIAAYPLRGRVCWVGPTFHD